MKNLSRRWLIGIAVVAIGLFAVGVPVLAASVGKSPAPQVGAPGAANAYNAVALDSGTLSRLATALGLTPADLTAQLQAGKTLAALAGEKNAPTATLVEAIIAPYADQVALQVKYGYITQAQAQTLLDNARQAAGTLLTQNLATVSGVNSWTGFCGNYLNGNPNTNTGWGMMGSGMMGSGMMGGWGGYTVNPVPATGTTTTATPPQPSTATGWGMMGGWGCR
ncbi:MAG: hypothetical protein TUN42_07415 [Dehalogenimonas sp.]